MSGLVRFFGFGIVANTSPGFGYVVSPPSEGTTSVPGILDFSDPNNSGLLILLFGSL